MKMYSVFTEDRYTLYVFSDFVLGPVQEVLFLFIFIIIHHHPLHACLQLDNRICRTINRNGNCLSCEFIPVAIYLCCRHGKWKPVSQSPSHSECSQVDSLFLGALI